MTDNWNWPGWKIYEQYNCLGSVPISMPKQSRSLPDSKDADIHCKPSPKWLLNSKQLSDGSPKWIYKYLSYFPYSDKFVIYTCEYLVNLTIMPKYEFHLKPYLLNHAEINKIFIKVSNIYILFIYI